MSELKYGRYFVLESQTDHLFKWAEENVPGDVSFYFCGICPVSDLLILNGVFERYEDREMFDGEYLEYQGGDSAIYTDRRNFKYERTVSEERRNNTERRRQPDRRQSDRGEGRRVDASTRRIILSSKSATPAFN